MAYVVGTFELPDEHASIGSMDVQLFPQQRPEILDGLIVLHDRDHTAFVPPPPLQARSKAQPSLQTDVGEDVPIIWRPASRPEQSESGRTLPVPSLQPCCSLLHRKRPIVPHLADLLTLRYSSRALRIRS